MKRKHNPSMLLLSGILVTIAIATSVLSGCNAKNPGNPQSTAQTVPAPADVNIKSKAISAYQALLSECPALEGEHTELEDASFGYDENLAKFGKHYDSFAISDLNHDGIPELIAMTIVNNRWTPVSVFTYHDTPDGEIQLLKDPADPESHATFEQMSTASGEYIFYICKDNHIHNLWSGQTPIGYQEENHAYVFTGNGLEATDCSLGAGGNVDSGDIAFRFSDTAVKNTEANRNVIPDM